MRYRVSKCIPNRHAGPLLPPHLSYWRDDTPSVAVLPTHFAISVVPHLFCCRIHPCFPPSLLTCSSAAAFAVDLVCHPHYPASPPHLFCHTPESLLRSSSRYLPSSHVICRRFCLPSRFGYSSCSELFCTALPVLLFSTLLFSLSALIFSIIFSFLFCYGSSLSPWFFHSALICRVFSPLTFTVLCSNLIIPLSSVWSNLISSSLIC